MTTARQCASCRGHGHAAWVQSNPMTITVPTITATPPIKPQENTSEPWCPPVTWSRSLSDNSVISRFLYSKISVVMAFSFCFRPASDIASVYRWSENAGLFGSALFPREQANQAAQKRPPTEAATSPNGNGSMGVTVTVHLTMQGDESIESTQLIRRAFR